jgi:hypothetical protein
MLLIHIAMYTFLNVTHHFRCLSKDDVNDGMIMEARDILAVFEGREPEFPVADGVLSF